MITIDVQKSKQCNGDVSLYVSFPFDANILYIMRNLSTRYWDKDLKVWEVPVRLLDHLISKLQDYDIHIVGQLDLLCDANKMDEIDINYVFKTVPFSHQIDGIQFGLTHDRWLLGDEQGLGKTKQVIDLATIKKQEQGYKHCLIICGVNGLKWNWRKEIATHSNEQCYLLGQRHRKRNNKFYIGSTADKLEDAKNIASIREYFIVTNAESLRDVAVSKALGDACKSGEIQMVAIDEIHKCKNPTSQQGKGILKLQPECRIAMSGTPLMNTPLDLYMILKWLGYEKHSFYSFKNHYCIMGGFGGYEVIGYKNVDELQDQVKEIMLRRLKEDVLDLPEKQYIDEYVEMAGKQEQIYKEVTASVKANIDQIVTSNNPLSQLIRLRQATGHTGILSSTVQESAKIDRLEEIVEESVANNRKVIIFSNWTQITNVVYEKLRKNFDGILITGDTNDAERQRCVDRFQSDDKCKYALGTIGAMGTGITLTAGTIVVFLDEPWTMANKQQAIDRCHRIGTKDNITVYTLMCKDTIDERIHEIVEKKGAISDALIDGKQFGTRAELVEFLIS